VVLRLEDKGPVPIEKETGWAPKAGLDILEMRKIYSNMIITQSIA
jgi:hypothetical protein